jgi:hypothetical protein
MEWVGGGTQTFYHKRNKMKDTKKENINLCCMLPHKFSKHHGGLAFRICEAQAKNRMLGMLPHVTNDVRQCCISYN